MVAKLTAAQAAQDYANGTLPAHVIVQDTAADVVHFLATLEQIALAGKLRAVELSGSTVLNLDVAQVVNDADVLSRIKGGYELAIADTAANVLASLANLERYALHGRITSITLTGSGHPVLNLTGAQVRHDVAALLKVSGASNEVVADTHAAIAESLDQLEKLAAAGKLASVQVTDGTALTVSASQVRADAKALATITGPYQLVVKDTLANVATYLPYLESTAAAGHLQKIVLTDSGSISLTSKQFFADGDALAKISGNYSLTVTGVLAANASTVAANAHVTALFVSDSAAHITQNLAQLEALAGGARFAPAGLHPSSDVLAGITLTDTGTPTISLSEDDLSGAEGVLGLITSPFILGVTGVLAVDAKPLSGNPLVDIVSVLDVSSSIVSNLSGLESVAKSGKLGTVTATDTALATFDYSDAAFSVYTHVTGTNGIALQLESSNFLGVQSGKFGTFLNSGAAAAGLSVPVSIHVEPNQELSGAFVLQLQHAADSGYLAGFTMDSGPVVNFLTTSDVLTIDNAVIIASMFGDDADIINFTRTTITAAQAVAYFSSPLSQAIEHSTAHVSGANEAYQFITDAAMIAGISDSAADLQANLDALATALAGRSLAFPIQLTDDLPPTIDLSAAQAVNDANVLNAITSSFLLSIDGSGSALNNIDLSALSSEKIELSFTSLASDVTVEGGHIVDLNLARLLVVNDVISVEAYSSGGQTGTEIDLTGTDGQTHKIILIGVNPSSLIVYTPFDTGTALGGHGTQVTGGVSVATALGGSGPVAITDTAANIQAHLDALEAIHTRITGIGFTDSGTPTLTLSEAQVASDSDILTLLSGTYRIALSGVAALDAASLAGRTDVSSIAVADSAADVAANFDALEHVAKAGKLAAITLTDSGTPTIALTEAQLFADQDALSAIGSSYSLVVTNALAIDAQSLSGNPLIHSVSVLDVSSSIVSNLSGLESVAKSGKLGTVTATDTALATFDYSDAAFSVYTHVTGTNGIALQLESSNFLGVQSGKFGTFLNSGAAAAGLSVPVSIHVEPNQELSGAFVLQLQHAADSGYLAGFTMDSGPVVNFLTTSDVLTIDNAVIIASMFGDDADIINFTRTTITAAQAVAYFSSPLSQAIEHSTAHVSGANEAYQFITDAAMIAGISDSAADLQANLDALATALAGRSLAFPIQLTDDLPPTIDLSAAQAVNDANVLNDISTTYLLSIGGTAEQLNGLSFSPPSNEKVELSLTSLDHDITVSGSVFDVDLAQLAIANDTVTVKAYSLGGQTGTEIDLTGTDGQAHEIILIGVTPGSFEVYAPVDSGLAAAGHGTQVTGGITVAQALVSPGPEAISDTAVNVAANLDALESIFNHITGIGFTDSGTPTLELTEAQFSADHDVLALLSGHYTLALTDVAASDAMTLATYTDVSGLFVADTGADLATELDQLEHVFKTGKLEGITITSGDLGTLTETQLLADSDVIKLIESNSDVFFH
jgi:hypothetical protein